MTDLTCVEPVLSEMLDEMNGGLPPNQRKAPRYKADFAAKVEGEFFCISAHVTNISSGGLRLRCGFHGLQEIMPNIKRPNRHLPIEFKVAFAVPTQYKASVDITVSCAMVYTRRIKESTAIVGCQFTQIDDSSAKALENYIRHFAEALV